MGVFPIAGPANSNVGCDYCAALASPQICEGCEKYHNHGGMHEPGHSLVMVCKSHGIEIKDKWLALREQRAASGT